LPAGLRSTPRRRARSSRVADSRDHPPDVRRVWSLAVAADHFSASGIVRRRATSRAGLAADAPQIRNCHLARGGTDRIGWDLKHIHRLMISLSAADSRIRRWTWATPCMRGPGRWDRKNSLLLRGNPSPTWEGEALRDAMLGPFGRSDLRMFGPWRPAGAARQPDKYAWEARRPPETGAPSNYVLGEGQFALSAVLTPSTCPDLHNSCPAAEHDTRPAALILQHRNFPGASPAVVAASARTRWRGRVRVWSPPPTRRLGAQRDVDAVPLGPASSRGAGRRDLSRRGTSSGRLLGRPGVLQPRGAEHQQFA